MERNFLSKLPKIFNNDVARQFFDATAEQLFSESKAEDIDAYIGRRVKGSFDPLNDYYIPQFNKSRTWNQLEPVISTFNKKNGNYENSTFYDDFINYLNIFGTLTENQGKLFNSKFYSFNPPIDIEKFINYQLFYWIDYEELTEYVISIPGLDDSAIASNIIGQKNYKIDIETDFNDLDEYELIFENGLLVTFPDSDAYQAVYVCNGVGTSITLSVIETPLLPNDGVIDRPDYFTIARGSSDRNLWSRTNRWIRVSAIKSMMICNNLPFPPVTQRAVNPIIEFDANIQRYRTFTKYISDINLFIDIPIDEIEQMTISEFEEQYTSIDNPVTAVFSNGREVYNIYNYLDQVKIEQNEDLSFLSGQCQIIDGEYRGYFVSSYGGWHLEHVQKNAPNISPLFMLYDSTGTPLDDLTKYPESSFNGSKIFSYKISETNIRVDYNLGIPIDYVDALQSSDMVFTNYLSSDRYRYRSGKQLVEISGYYFYYDDSEKTHRNEWLLSDIEYIQRVVRKYAAIDDSDNSVNLSVVPNNDIEVYKNGIEVPKDSYYVDSTSGKVSIILDQVKKNDDIEITFTTEDKITELSPEFYEVPKNIHSNALYGDIKDISYGEINPHFESIIRNQDGYNKYNTYSEYNNFRFLDINRGLGNIITQPLSSIAKSMMVSVNDVFPLIDSIEYVKNEYNSFKKKFISMSGKVKYLIESNDISYSHGVILEILEMLRVSEKSLNGFKYSRMLPTQNPDMKLDTSANTSVGELNIPFTNSYRYYTVYGVSKYSTVVVTNTSLDTQLIAEQDYILQGNRIRFNNQVESRYRDGDNISISFTNLVCDLKGRNISEDGMVFLYKVDDYVNRFTKQKTLTDLVDYELIESYDEMGELKSVVCLNQDTFTESDEFMISMYLSNPVSYIPATPSKLGITPCFIPRVEILNTYASPRIAIIGHDGSTNLAFGNYTPSQINVLNDPDITTHELFSNFDIRDVALLELERHIYNGIDAKFKGDKKPLYSTNDFVSNPFNQKYLTYNEFIDSYRHDFLRWTIKNKLDYKINDTTTSNWKTWNYSDFNKVVWNGSSYIEIEDKMLGNFRGIFNEYYGTITPNKPWQLLGLSSKPEWWDSDDLGNDGFSGYGSDYSHSNTAMWTDIELGIIRRGESKGYHPELRRPGLCGSVTVSNLNPMIGNQLMTPFYSSDFTTHRNLIPVGDNNSIKSIVEIFGYPEVTNPSNKEWKVGDLSPVEYSWFMSHEYRYSLAKSMFICRPGDFGELFFDTQNYTVFSNQFINDKTNFRSINDTYKLHQELENNTVCGYQQWLVDFVISKNLDVTTYIGDVIRGITLNLGHKVGGFTDSDTMRVFLQNVTTLESDSLLIPSENYQVMNSVNISGKQYKMSGVIIVSNGDGSFSVVGYDTLDPWFEVLPKHRSAKGMRISVGGDPVKFREYEFGETYIAGEYVRYNGRYYQAKVNVYGQTFDSDEWERLPSLPVKNALDVIYYSKRDNEPLSVPYGTKFTNIQDLYDFIIGYGAYLESMGWVYDEVNESGVPVDWKNSAYSMLSWIKGNWGKGNTYTMCPSSLKLTHTADFGVPIKVEDSHKGIYNILDRYGYPMSVKQTNIVRDTGKIIVESNNIDDGIYFLNLIYSEAEHVIIFDNETDFGDVMFNPILNSRQARLKFQGKRTTDWRGKFEASGFIIGDGTLTENPESLVSSLRTLYSEDNIDSNKLSEAAKKLIGFQEREYLTDLGLSKRTQYHLYKGMITEKGTFNSLSKLFRQKDLAIQEDLNAIEEWAFKVSEYGTVKNNIEVVFDSNHDLVNKDPQVYRIYTHLSAYNSIRVINILSAADVYSEAPEITFEYDGTPNRPAKAKAILNASGVISEVLIIDGGDGYISEPSIVIDLTNRVIDNGGDILTATMSRISRERKDLNNIVVDINNHEYVDKTSDISLINSDIKMVSDIAPEVPHAGFVSFNDVDFYVFDDIKTLWDKTIIPDKNSLIWKANYTDDSWAVLSMREIELSWDLDNDILSIDNIVGQSYKTLKQKYPETKFTRSEDGTYFSSQMVCVYTDTLKKIAIDIETDENGIVTNYQDLKKQVLYGGKIFIFVNRRVPTVDAISEDIMDDKLIWVDNNGSSKWQVQYHNGTVHRVEEDLIDTNMFDALEIESSSRPLIIKQVYDPIKGIFDAEFDNNIDYRGDNDPAVYTDQQPVPFGREHVGKIWWDLSETKFVYYELPKSSSESERDIIEYRRNNWGKVFPGSKVRFCQWIESEVPPSRYEGDGVPLDINKYNEVRRYISSIDSYDVKYYFWVYDSTEVHRDKTLSTTQLSNTIVRPKYNNVSWYSPIYKSEQEIAICIYNSSNELTTDNSKIKLSYKLRDNKGEVHNEWYLLRDNDRHSKIPDSLWGKFVCSLIGYTDLLPKDEYQGGITIDSENVVLPVPAYSLSENNKFGVSIRPQRTLFDNNKEARRTVGEVINQILSGFKFFEMDLSKVSYPLTDSNILDNIDWIHEDYDELPKYDYSLETELELSEKKPIFIDGDIIRIYDISGDGLEPYKYYRFDKESYDFTLIAYQDGTYKLNDNYYDISIGNVGELHHFFNSLKYDVLVRDYRYLQNTIFFSGIEYAFSENYDIDWAFKTSYVTILQNIVVNDTTSTLIENVMGSYLSYFNEIKPYHTKIRQVISVLSEILDIAYIDVIDFLNMKINLIFARHGNTADIFHDTNTQSGWDNQVHDWSEEAWDATNPDYKHRVLESSVYSGDVNSTVRKSSETGEELVTISPNETLIIDIVDDVIIPKNDHWDTDNWDINNWDLGDTDYDDYTTIAYRLHYSRYSDKPENYALPVYDLVNGDKVFDCYNPLIVVSIESGEYTKITLSHVHLLTNHEKSLLWIEKELLSYDGYTTNPDGTCTLFNIRRSINGTSKYEISVGDVAIPAIQMPGHIAYMYGRGGVGTEYYMYVGQTKQPQYMVSPQNDFITATNPWFFNLNLLNLDKVPEYTGTNYRRLIRSSGAKFLATIDFCHISNSSPLNIEETTFNVSSDTQAVFEGDQVNFTISSNNFGSGLLKYQIIPSNGMTIDDIDNISLNGSTYMYNNYAKLRISASMDELEELTETFTLRITDTSGNILVTSQPVNIIDRPVVPVLSVSLSSNILNETNDNRLVATIRSSVPYNDYYNYEIVPVFGDVNQEDIIEQSTQTNRFLGDYDTIYIKIKEDRKTEGEEQFKLVYKNYTTGEIIAESDTVTINDTSLDDIFTISNAASVNEGSSVSIKVSCNNIQPTTRQYEYEIVSVSGDVSADDFETLPSNPFAFDEYNRAFLRFYMKKDRKTEGEEQFKLVIRDLGGSEILVESDIFTINDTSLSDVFTISNAVPVDEGDSIFFRVSCNNIQPTTRQFEYDIVPVAGDLNIDDFETLPDNPFSFNIYNRADLNFSIKKDYATEGEEQFKVIIRDLGGSEILVESDIITINDTSLSDVFTAIPSTLTSDEWRTFYIKFECNNSVEDTRQFEYDIVPVAGDLNIDDFDALASNPFSFSADDKRVDLNFSIKKDYATEGEEQFKVIIRDLGGSEIIAESDIITINDTSLSDVFTTSVSDQTENEWGYFYITLRCTNAQPDGQQFEYEIVSVTGNVSADDFETLPNNPFSFTVYDNRGSINFYLKEDYKTEGEEQFKVIFRKFGETEIIAESDIITINDTSLDDVFTISNITQIDEGTGMTFSVYCNNEQESTREFEYEIVSVTGNVSADDFETLPSNPFSFSASYAYRAQLYFKLKEDYKTEGEEQFKVVIRDLGGSEILVESDTVTINDTSLDTTYTLTPYSVTVQEELGTTITMSSSNPVSSTLQFEYEIIPISGNLTIDDFETLPDNPFDFSGTTNLYFGLKADYITEGDEQFQVVVRPLGESNIVATSLPITITDFTITAIPSRTSLVETTEFYVNVTANRNIDNFRIYYEIVSITGNVTSADFKNMAPNPSIFNNYTARLDFDMLPDGVTEGEESFRIDFRRKIDGPVVASTPILTIRES